MSGDFIGVEFDPRDFDALMKAISRGNRVIGREMFNVRHKAAAMIRDAAFRLAPRRRNPKMRSLASRLYGPLSSAKSYEVQPNRSKGGGRAWGVRFPYYANFLPDYSREAEQSTRGARNRYITERLSRALAKHFGDQIGGQGRAGADLAASLGAGSDA